MNFRELNESMRLAGALGTKLAIDREKSRREAILQEWRQRPKDLASRPSKEVTDRLGKDPEFLDAYGSDLEFKALVNLWVTGHHPYGRQISEGTENLYKGLVLEGEALKAFIRQNASDARAQAFKEVGVPIMKKAAVDAGRSLLKSIFR